MQNADEGEEDNLIDNELEQICAAECWHLAA